METTHFQKQSMLDGTNPLNHSKATVHQIYKALSADEPPVGQVKWETELNSSPDWYLIWKCAKNTFLDKYQCDLNWSQTYGLT